MKYATVWIFLLWSNVFFLFSIKKVTAFPLNLDNAEGKVADKDKIFDNVEVVQVKGEPVAKIVETKQSDSKGDKNKAVAVAPLVTDSDTITKTKSQVQQVSPLQTAEHKNGHLHKQDHNRVTSNTKGQKSTQVKDVKSAALPSKTDKAVVPSSSSAQNKLEGRSGLAGSGNVSVAASHNLVNNIVNLSAGGDTVITNADVGGVL